MWQLATVWQWLADSEDIMPRWDQITSSSSATHCSFYQQIPSEQRPQWQGPRWPSNQGNERAGPSHLPWPLTDTDSCWLCQSRKSANNTTQGVSPICSHDTSVAGKSLYLSRCQERSGWALTEIFKTRLKRSRGPHEHFVLNLGYNLESLRNAFKI